MGRGPPLLLDMLVDQFGQRFLMQLVALPTMSLPCLATSSDQQRSRSQGAFHHADRVLLRILSLVLLVCSILSSFVLIATSRNYTINGPQTVVEARGVFDVDIPLMFVTTISFVALQIAVLGLMVFNIASRLTGRTGDRSIGFDNRLIGGMSNMLTP